MPIPKPKKGEKQKDFIGRCMGAIGDEYDSNDQALAVCYTTWKNKDKKSMDEDVERRSIPMEIRMVTDDEDHRKIVGHAAVFDSWSEDLGGFKEKIAAGAFAKVKSDTRMLFNHDPNYVLGRKSAKTLTLKEDKNGLYVENIPPDTQWARDLMVSIDRGDINQMSFGFRVDKDEWTEDKEGRVTRTILEVKELLDVSPVTFPAYSNTDVALRSMDEWKSKEQEKRDEEARGKEEQERLQSEEQEKLQKERLRLSESKQREIDLKEKMLKD